MVYEGGMIFAIILMLIVAIVAFSAVCAVILWGCARGIGKVENATYLNSWGLFWILTVSQLILSLFVSGVTFLVFGARVFYDSYDMFFWIFTTSWWLSVIFVYIVNIFIALFITKIFWKCTLKQSFMTHLIPVTLYTLLMAFYFIFLYNMIYYMVPVDAPAWDMY